MVDPDKSKSPEVKEIPFNLYKKQGNKTTQLVNCKQGFAIDGNNRWYEFEFLEPIYITGIEIRSSGYEQWDRFSIEVQHTDETTHQERIAVNGGVVSLALGKLSRKFRFKPDSKFLSETKINLVKAFGYTLQEFHSFEHEVSKIKERMQQLSEKESTVQTIEATLTSLRADSSKIRAEIDILKQERAEEKSLISNLNNQSETLDSQVEDMRQELDTLREQRREARAEIANDQGEHLKLTRELRLFPSEIAGFVAQGNRNITTYFFLAVPFTLIFALVTWSLFFSAIDLTQLWKKDPEIDVWTIFLTRLPFVIVALAIIESCGFIVGRLIFEIIKINRQRLEFSKLSIVAKDVTTASSLNTEMTDEDRFREETKIKMGLLQEHMKNHSPEEFKFQGSAITSVISGVVNKISTKNDGS